MLGCQDAKVIVQCAMEKSLTDAIIAIFKPVVCNKCKQRYADVNSLKTHTNLAHHGTLLPSSESVSPVVAATRLRSMSVAQLKAALKQKGLSTSGNKEVLMKRLEGTIAAQL